MLPFTCNNVVSVWRGFLFLWVLGMGCVILLGHFLSLPYNYFSVFRKLFAEIEKRLKYQLNRIISLFGYVSYKVKTYGSNLSRYLPSKVSHFLSLPVFMFKL